MKYIVWMLLSISLYATTTTSCPCHKPVIKPTYDIDYQPRLKRYRDPEVRRRFQRLHPCPKNWRRAGACPGYVVDHKIALCKGGPDSVDNMQWQTVAAAKAKDRWECK